MGTPNPIATFEQFAFRSLQVFPRAKDNLTGNMPTENMIQYFVDNQEIGEINLQAFDKSLQMAVEVFPTH